MEYRLLPPGRGVGVADLNAAWTAQRRNTDRLLAAMFAGPGIAYGLGVMQVGPLLTVAPGLALFGADATRLVPVSVSETRASPWPTTPGKYVLCVLPGALIHEHPAQYTTGGDTPRTVSAYLTERAEAAFADAVIKDAAVIAAGLVFAPKGAVPPAGIALAGFEVTAAGELVGLHGNQRRAAAVRGTRTPLAAGSVDTAHLSGELLARFTAAEQALGRPEVEEDALLPRDGSRAMEAPLDLGGHGVRNLGDLDLGGHRLDGVVALGGPEGAPVEANVTHLGGRTAEELVEAARQDLPAGSAYVQHFVVKASVPLGGAVAQPGPLSASLPGNLPLGARGVTFQGRGTLSAVRGDALIFMPELQEAPLAAVPWQDPSGGDPRASVRFGPVFGTADAFYFSLVHDYDDGGVRRSTRSLQRVVPGSAPVVADSVTAVLAPEGEPEWPGELGVRDGKLVWAERPQFVAAEGEHLWVGGYRVQRTDRAGVTLARGTLVVDGLVLVTVARELVALAVSP